MPNWLKLAGAMAGIAVASGGLAGAVFQSKADAAVIAAALADRLAEQRADLSAQKVVNQHVLEQLQRHEKQLDKLNENLYKIGERLGVPGMR